MFRASAFLRQKRIYLDYASATPVSDVVRSAMRPYETQYFGNPSAVHQEGRKAKEAVDYARGSIAKVLRVQKGQVYFTGSGTESNALALSGYIASLETAGEALSDIEVLTTRLEHPSVTGLMKELEKRGVKVTYLAVDEEGLINSQTLKNALSLHTRVVSIAYANSETGIVQDIKKLSRVIRAHEKKNSSKIMFHTDAAQAPLWLPCALDALGVDALSIDAGKCYGPKGVGVLVYRSPLPLTPLLHGGGQERGIRSGTEAVAGIVGAAVALVEAQKNYEVKSEKTAKLQKIFLEKLSQLNEVMVNGSLTRRLPSNLNISLLGYDGEYATVWLDESGIACSTRSACSTGSGAGSQVVWEMTGDEARAISTIRFTFDETLRVREMDTVVTALKDFIALQAR